MGDRPSRRRHARRRAGGPAVAPPAAAKVKTPTPAALSPEVAKQAESLREPPAKK